ncbi:uncharacterized protein NEMAJ01_2285 [Nematocida major]|uniref:uncharacterized protein n=1 Tax=Nematocida major TaxID=1912982 RepID=UPI002007DCA9|nr:uncharacterized protein NEMAJ01_2285 [Nematocida major]KAH9387389.1 hypothetical protein NEMAJ01_2285 [Nematocida major]
MGVYKFLLESMHKEVCLVVAQKGATEKVTGELLSIDEHLNVILCTEAETRLYYSKHIIEYILPQKNKCKQEGARPPTA